LIPGLEEARFLRFGVMHRNTFLDAPRLITPTLAWRAHPHIHFAGQLSGTEGYTEAIASGLVAALAVYAQINGQNLTELPAHSLFGALLAYASDPATQPYQPMHVNYGLLEPLAEPLRNRKRRYQQYAARADQAIRTYRESNPELDWLPEVDRSFLLTDDRGADQPNEILAGETSAEEVSTAETNADSVSAAETNAEAL
jgi:methylenetetrahydrofolate--tRNA-(uracil-5-)-methyltransferase